MRMRNRGAGGHRTGCFCWRESSKPGVMISSSTRIAFPPLRRGHQFVDQRPLKAGFLFSANALTPQPDPSSSTQPHKPHSPPPLPSLTHSRSSSPAPGAIGPPSQAPRKIKTDLQNLGSRGSFFLFFLWRDLNEPVAETHEICFLPSDPSSGQNHIARAIHADEAGEAVCAPHAGDDCKPYLRLADYGG